MTRIDCIIVIMLDGTAHYLSKNITLTDKREEAMVFNGRNRAKRVLDGMRKMGVRQAHIEIG